MAYGDGVPTHVRMQGNMAIAKYAREQKLTVAAVNAYIDFVVAEVTNSRDAVDLAVAAKAAIVRLAKQSDKAEVDVRADVEHDAMRELARRYISHTQRSQG